MKISTELMTLAQYIAGEFDNKEQAIAEPTWYVPLRLWQRPVPVPLFPEPSISLYAEQVNMMTPDRVYRPRLMQLRQSQTGEGLEVQYYQLMNRTQCQGAGNNPELLKGLTRDRLELLPGCTLTVTQENIGLNHYRFRAQLPANSPCRFSHQGETFQVELGFEATSDQFLSYDKGINPTTGQALWGALMGPFRLHKRQDFASEIPIFEV
ncbi:MAG: chromophore lyase CpcT/CpeT [Microcoleaceae cyanobacterium]